MQNFIKRASPRIIEVVFEEIKHDILRLMKDDYGNYFCKELVGHLSTPQRTAVLKMVEGDDFMDISCSPKGTHSLQTLIRSIT